MVQTRERSGWPAKKTLAALGISRRSYYRWLKEEKWAKQLPEPPVRPVQPYEALPEGSATVGFEVCIKHVAAVAEGATCTARAKLTDVVDDRKLFFEVEVREGERTIGVGTHQRRVIPVPAES